MKGPIFLCHSDPHHLVTAVIGALEYLALHGKEKKINLFSDTDTTIKIKLGIILHKLTQRHNRKERADLDDCENETCSSTQFLQIEKKQIKYLQEHLDPYCEV